METLGQLLKREREFRGISREDVTRLTRISKATITILEEDLPVSPGQSIYFRSYLKNYARQIGLDPNEVAARFQSERGEAETPPTPIASHQMYGGPSRAIVIAAAVVVVLGIAAYWMKRHGESHPPIATPASAPAEFMSSQETPAFLSHGK